MRLDIQTRKWTNHKNTLGEHICPGCLVTQDHLFLYIFSEEGVERRMINADYTPWEAVHTNIKFDNLIKFYPLPNVNNQFYLFQNK